MRAPSSPIPPSSHATGRPVEHKTSTPEAPLVEVTKVLNAPVARVFGAWAQDHLVAQWWGPEGMTCPYAKTDFKVDGQYLFAMRSQADEKKTLWSTGTYLEIVPDQKIVMSDQPADEEGRVITPPEAGFEGPWPDEGLGYITVEFESLGANQTRLRLAHENLPARMHEDCVEGWSSSLDKLKTLVERH